MSELSESSPCSNIFRGLSTQAQQMQYFRSKYNYDNISAVLVTELILVLALILVWK